ncbi:hypothetical protein Tco_0932774 [Tanacetum coccineum]
MKWTMRTTYKRIHSPHMNFTLVYLRLNDKASKESYNRFVSLERDISLACSVAVYSLSASVAEVPSASVLQVLRRLGSIFTSVYAAVQKLKKDSWLELQFSLTDNSKLNVVYLLNKS